MSKSIEITDASVREGIGKLDKSISGLEGNLGQTLDDDNKLKIVNNYNKIKADFDKILSEYGKLLSQNIKLTEKSVEDIQYTDREVATGIRLAK